MRLPFIKQPKVTLPAESSLDRLVRQLKDSGIVMNVRDYIEFIAVFQHLKDTEPTELKYYLAPLTCRSENEQQTFYKVYHKWLDNEAERLIKQSAKEAAFIRRRKFRLLYLIAGASILLLLLVIRRPCHQENGVVINSNWVLTGNNTVNDTIIFNGNYTGKLKPASDTIYYAVDFGDGNSVNSQNPLIKHVYKKSNKYHVWLRVRKVNKIIGAKDSTITICPVPGLIKITPSKVDPGKRVNLQFIPAANFIASSSLKWSFFDNITGDLINSRTFKNTKLSYWPKQSGSFTVSLLDTLNNGCSIADGALTVNPPPNPYSLNAELGGPQIKQTYFVNWTIVTLIALIIASSVFLLQYLYSFFFPPKKIISTEKQAFPLPDLGKSGREKPSIIPFENKDQLIRQERELVRVFQELQQKIPAELYSLDISKTVRGTIYNHGLFSPVYAARKLDLHYVFLIDGYGNYNQQINLFTFLVKIFIKENIQLSVYYFFQSIDVCCNADKTETFTLSELYSRLDLAVLLVISDGYRLINSSFPTLIRSLTSKIEQWEKRILVTPVPAKDWGSTEKLLSEVFRLVPADLEGWVRIIQMINEPQSLKVIPFEWLDEHVNGINFEDFKQLKFYINDDDILQWLCAISVYPRIRWEVIIAIGQKILDNSQAIHKLNYTNLLKLARVSWIKTGVFPTGIRLELLIQLTVENEILARKTVLQLMAESDNTISENSFSFKEKQAQIYISSFVVFSNDPLANPDLEQNSLNFLGLWESKAIADAALSVYLINEKRKWETPIILPGKIGNHAGIDDYINSHPNKKGIVIKPKLWTKLRITSFACAFLILSLFLGIIFNKYSNAIYQKNINNLLPIVEPDTTALTSVRFNIDTNGCLKSWSRDSIWFVTLNTSNHTYRKEIGAYLQQSPAAASAKKSKAKIYQVVFDSIPTQKLIAKPLNVALTDFGGESLAATLSSFSNHYNLSVTGSNCKIPAGITVFIQYDNKIAPYQAETFRQCIVSNGYIAEKTENRQGPGYSVVRYFNVNMKAKAEKLATIASDCFMANFVLQYIAPLSKKDELINDPKTLEIWLNGNQNCRNVSFDSIPNLITGNTYYNADMSDNIRLYKDSICFSFKNPMKSFPFSINRSGRPTKFTIANHIKNCGGNYTLYITGNTGKIRDSVIVAVYANSITVLSSKSYPTGRYNLLFNTRNYQQLSNLNNREILGTWVYKDTVQITNNTIIRGDYNKGNPIKIIKVYYDNINQSYIIYYKIPDKTVNYGILVIHITTAGVYALSSGDGVINQKIFSSPPTNMLLTNFGGFGILRPVTEGMPTKSQGFAIWHDNLFLDSLTIIKDKIKFVFIKATEGATYADPKCGTNVALAKRYNLQYSLFHFFTPNVSAERQASNFNNAYLAYGSSLPLCVNLEDNKAQPIADKNRYIDSAIKFISLLRNKGNNVIVFTYSSFANKYLDSRFGVYQLAILNYSGNYDPNQGIRGIWNKADYWMYNDAHRMLSNVGSSTYKAKRKTLTKSVKKL